LTGYRGQNYNSLDLVNANIDSRDFYLCRDLQNRFIVHLWTKQEVTTSDWCLNTTTRQSTQFQGSKQLLGNETIAGPGLRYQGMVAVYQVVDVLQEQ